jgi:mandelate racemase
MSAMSDVALTIRELKVRAVEAPLPRPLRTAAGTIPAAPLLLIDVETAQGVVGRAYIFAYTKTVLAPLGRLAQEIVGELAGESAAPAVRMQAFERRFRLLGRQGLLGMLLSGIDMALWDALGRAADCPVVRLLGGEPAALPAYDSFGIVDPRADERAIRQSVERGFRAIKIKLGDGDMEKDAATVAAVRAMIGPGIALMVDYNQSLDVPEALRRIARLAAHDIAWVEEPVPAEDIHGHARVRAASSVPVQTGENWWFPRDMANAIAAGASDYAMLDVMKIGGITGWLRAAGQAEAASLPVSSHIFVEASAHLLPVMPTAHWLEYLDSAGAILAEPPIVLDGRITAKGPGLGMSWDERAVARFAL